MTSSTNCPGAEKAERLLQGRRAVDFNWKRLGLGLLGVAVLVMVVAALLLVRSGMASSWPASGYPAPLAADDNGDGA